MESQGTIEQLGRFIDGPLHKSLGKNKMEFSRKHYLKCIVCAAMLAAGAILFVISDTFAAKSKTRTYYIAAEDVLWDYAPSYPKNRMTDRELTEEQKVFVDDDSDDRIGRRYWKALYRAYTDDTFTTPKPTPPEWQHLGTLGPIVRAAVGDTIVIVFKNKTANKTLSLHPHGLLYHKDSEGSLYNDGTSDAAKADDAVAPGATYT